MKFSFFFTELFWGGLLMLLGISMIIKTIFHIDIPIMRTALAILLIYAGFSIITGIGSNKKNRQTIAFEQETIIPEKVDNYYSIMFGKGVIDLTHVKNLDETQKVKINTLFGESIIKINPKIPTIIHVQATFGNAKFPDGTSIS